MTVMSVGVRGLRFGTMIATSIVRAGRPQSVVTRRRFSVHASLSVVVKGNPDTKVLPSHGHFSTAFYPQTLGDCPFCHRALLTMEQKRLAYDRIYVDLKNKPAWLLEANPAGTVPVLKVQEQYIPDSDVIVEYLEEKFPLPSVPADPEGLQSGSGIFGAFRARLLNTDTSQESTLEKALHEEIMKLEKRLASMPGPFLGGDGFNAADAALLPRLYHTISALSHFKSWSIPEDCPKVTSKKRRHWRTS